MEYIQRSHGRFLVYLVFVTPSVPFALLTALVPLKEGQCLWSVSLAVKNIQASLIFLARLSPIFAVDREDTLRSL